METVSCWFLCQPPLVVGCPPPSEPVAIITNHPMDKTDAQDAARYRWIKAQKNLAIRTNRTCGAPWTKTDTGEKYYPSHQLDVNGTGFNGIEHFDDLIDQAMEMYP